MRDFRRLQVFALADELVLEIYALTRKFPSDERFGLTSQLRRGAVSIASNLIEGCSRDSPREFAQFVTIAHGSALEVQYQLSLARRLAMATLDEIAPLEEKATRLAKMLHALAGTMRARSPKAK